MNIWSWVGENDIVKDLGIKCAGPCGLRSQYDDKYINNKNIYFVWLSFLIYFYFILRNCTFINFFENKIRFILDRQSKTESCLFFSQN